MIKKNLLLLIMIEINDYVSKIFYKNNSYCILTYIDIDEAWSNAQIINFMNVIIEKNAILTQTIKEKNKLIFLDVVKSFVLSDYYTIEYTNHDLFDSYIPNLLNSGFETEAKWKFLWCLDKDAQKTRFFFKIQHAYADGYNVIDLLTTSEKGMEKITDKFKRFSEGIFNKLYHYIISSLLLIHMNVRCFFNILWNQNTIDNSDIKKDTDYICCKALNLIEIKKFTNDKNLTVNDFLYALMVKTDRLYKKENRTIKIWSPIHIHQKREERKTNNICFTVNQIKNSYNNLTLLQTINTTLNQYKYSIYIPTLNWFLNCVTPYLSLELLSFIYNKLNNVDYIFSSSIGPTMKSYKIADIHFLMNNKNNEIVYNIISSGNNVNIICSFKEGIIADKARFEQCIYEAYNSLILTTE